MPTNCELRKFRKNQNAYTLVELLVVIGIIVVLLAILIPALGMATKALKRNTCLSNQSLIVKNCQMYALDHPQEFWPSAVYPKSRGNNFARSAELQTTSALSPLSLGYLVTEEYMLLPSAADAFHCPQMDTTASPKISRYGMDVPVTGDANTVGASYWGDGKTKRVASSYMYRHMTYARVNDNDAGALGSNPYAMLRTMTTDHDFVVLADNFNIDLGRKFTHKDGYNRVFGDGSGGYFLDIVDEAGIGKVEHATYSASLNRPDPNVGGFSGSGLVTAETGFIYLAKSAAEPD